MTHRRWMLGLAAAIALSPPVAAREVLLCASDAPRSGGETNAVIVDPAGKTVILHDQNNPIPITNDDPDRVQFAGEVSPSVDSPGGRVEGNFDRRRGTLSATLSVAAGPSAERIELRFRDCRPAESRR